jgi:hypothetical protein
MKILTLAGACCAAALLSGCESGGSSDLPELMTLGAREAPRSRTYQADQKATYEAAKAVVAKMDYTFVRGGPAEGRLEALSSINRGEEPGSSRQLSLKVTFGPGASSGTEMVVSFTEIIEADSANQPGMATQTPLHDTPLYEDFFRDVQRALDAPPRP